MSEIIIKMTREQWSKHCEAGTLPKTGHIVLDPEDRIYCDLCDKEFTNSKESGGFLFQSKGVAPCCSERFMKTVKGYNEESHIRGHCPEGMSFADWIRKIR